MIHDDTRHRWWHQYLGWLVLKVEQRAPRFGYDRVTLGCKRCDYKAEVVERWGNDYMACG